MQQIKFFILILCISQFATVSAADNNDSIADYINPLIGTARAGNGGTLPGVTMPFGMTQFAPMTNQNRIGRMPYYYDEKSIVGFIATHQQTVWMGDYGQLSIMPQIGKLEPDFEKRKYSFSHVNEISKAYYYAVELETSQNKVIKTEIGADKRCGFFRFTFPKNESPRLIIDATRDNRYDGSIQIDALRNEITGYNTDIFSGHLGPKLKNFKGYFVIRVSQPIVDYGVYYNDTIVPNVNFVKHKVAGAYIEFGKSAQVLEVQIGTSFISVKQARENLSKEINNKSFEQVVQHLKNVWNKELSVVELKTDSYDEKVTYYTAMYHSLLYPREFSEYGKYYSAFDDKIHKGISYNDYSLWDTYRALHPLFILINKERVGPMITSLLQMYKEGGWLPKWPNPTYTNIMIATHADAVIADAYVKGIRNFNVKLAYKAMWKNAFVPPPGDTGNVNYVKSPWGKYDKPLKMGAGNPWWDRADWHGYEARAGLTWYKKLGYVPSDMTRESVSNTIESSYNDFCIAQVAQALNKKDDYNIMMQRSKNH